jgi:hypothetical protein
MTIRDRDTPCFEVRADSLRKLQINVFVGFDTGIPRVGFGHTVTVPPDTVPVPGEGIYRTVACTGSRRVASLNQIKSLLLQK